MSDDHSMDTGPSQTGNDIVTKAERDSLEAGRAEPHAEPHLTPGGDTETTVKRDIEEAREARIKHIDQRLEAARTRLRADHSKALVAGRAKTDFDRCR